MEKKQISFRTMWSNPLGVVGQDLSDPFQDLIEEIPPFTKDESGKWLNDSSVPKFVKRGKINVQEQIQSYADDVDIYKILEKFAASGDESIINKNVGFYADISQVPTNFNDFQDYLLSNAKNLDLFSPDMKKAILNGDSINTDMLDSETKRIAKEKYGVDFDNIKKGEEAPTPEPKNEK